ncbi:MAG: hypothetical protein NO114_06200 [Sulfolobales archaeon]|nr:hypothetical protein [Sulfolobales archaeon]
MESSIVAILLLIATLVLALGAFALYSVVFSDQYYTVSVQEYLIGISKLISVEVSQPTYAGIPPSYNYFNVSYVVWIQSPAKTVTVVPFVASPQPNPSYIFPSSSQNASLFTSSLNGYSSLRPFNLNATVYLPQGGQPLANIHVIAYNVSSNSTYVLSAVVRPSQIIMLWLLYYYDGKWYRLDYVYLSPFSSGLGVYIITGSGMYNGYSGTLNNPAPHILHSQTAFQLGMWFKVINVKQSPTPLLNATFIPTGNGVGNGNGHGNGNGKEFSVILYTQGSSVYVNIIGTTTNETRLLYNNLKAGQSYFINFTSGSQLGLSQLAKFTIYNEQGQQLNSFPLVMILPSEINGYTLILTFGSKTISNGISQAFIETIRNTGSISPFWSVSNIALHNGPLYNDTDRFNQTIAQNPSLNALAYWYFVWPYNNPPPQLIGILWYWPSYTTNYPDIYYIPENGTNTYVVV